MKWISIIVIVFLVSLIGCTKSTEPENSAPNTPRFPSPSDGATDQMIDVNLDWTGGDPDNDPVRYDVYLGAASSPSLVASDVPNSNYDPGVLEYGTQYYWRIVARDNSDLTTEGSTWSFTTGQTPITPANLSIVADSEGDGIILSWDLSEKADAYSVITPDNDTFSLTSTETSYHDDSPLSTGTYTVYSFNGANMSAPATANDVPLSDTTDYTVYSWNSGDPSGFGWNTSGEGALYMCDDAGKSVIDFYLDDDQDAFDFISCDQPPFSGNRTTGILDMGATSFFTAPAAGYNTADSVIAGNYYAMKIQEGYFMKVFVVSADTIRAMFNYEFQTIQSLRLF